MSPLDSIYFLDIETVPGSKTLPQGKDRDFFEKRFRYQIDEKNTDVDTLWTEKAALYAEYGKIICIGLGKMSSNKFYVKCFSGMREDLVLADFILRAAQIGQEKARICGHNILDFDIPMLIRRILIRKMSVPTVLEIQGKKPWEMKDFIDTMLLWGLSQYNYRISLDQLCHSLGIQSPKGGMSGADVMDIYAPLYDVPADELVFDKEKEVFDKINQYCGDDVIADARLYCRLKGLPDIEDSQIIRL
jgi:hypothetical protein